MSGLIDDPLDNSTVGTMAGAPFGPAFEETAGATTTTLLSEWIGLTDYHIKRKEYEQALVPIRLILKRLPRHLPTYERLLHVAWQLRLWDEGLVWAARLLNADPGNALAWRSLAAGMEERGNRARARQIWQRAFEKGPYDPTVRVGLSRTTLHSREPLALNPACLVTLYLSNQQWQQAEEVLETLLFTQPPQKSGAEMAQSQRADQQVGLMMAQWQRGRRQQAYRLARQLLQKGKNLLFPWYVLNDLGDINDKALAHNPIQMMDPNGEYIQNRFGIKVSPKFIEFEVTSPEVELLGVMG